MSRWMPATPTSAINSARLPRTLAVWRASSATGRSAVPAQTTSTLPTARFGRGGRGARAGADDHYSGRFVYLGLRERCGEGRPSGVVDPGGQYDRVAGGQAADDRHQLLGSLAHAEDHFGETDPQRAMVVERGEPQALDRRLGDGAGGAGGREIAAAHALEHAL